MIINLLVVTKFIFYTQEFKEDNVSKYNKLPFLDKKFFEQSYEYNELVVVFVEEVLFSNYKTLNFISQKTGKSTFIKVSYLGRTDYLQFLEFFYKDILLKTSYQYLDVLEWIDKIAKEKGWPENKEITKKIKILKS